MPRFAPSQSRRRRQTRTEESSGSGATSIPPARPCRDGYDGGTMRIRAQRIGRAWPGSVRDERLTHHGECNDHPVSQHRGGTRCRRRSESLSRSGVGAKRAAAARQRGGRHALELHARPGDEVAAAEHRPREGCADLARKSSRRASSSAARAAARCCLANEGGKWRGPAFYTMATASVGFQAGVSVSEWSRWSCRRRRSTR